MLAALQAMKSLPFLLTHTMTTLIRLSVVLLSLCGAWAEDFVGKTVVIRLSKESTSCVRIGNFVPKIGAFDKADPDNCRFKIAAGPDPGTVTIESVKNPGLFLKHRNYQLQLLAKINPDAMWRIVNPLQGNQGISLQSVNFPAHHIAMNDKKELWILKTPKQKRDAVFFLDDKTTP